MSRNGILTNFMCAICLVCLSAPLHASNLRFAKDMPVSQMTDSDIEIMSAAVDETLSDVADGVARHWKNPETDAGGTLTPLSTSEESGLLCRRLEIANQAKGMSARSVHQFCRQADGLWKIRSAPAGAASR
jgi:surface antigen